MYKIIYSDPPWSFKTWSDKGKDRSADSHYEVMKAEDIKNLPVQNICDPEGSILFLWVTFPCLQEGLECMKAWGFDYKTCAFNWVKRNKKADFIPEAVKITKGMKFSLKEMNLDKIISWFWGMGHWTRTGSEICIMGTRGNFPKRVSKAVHQIVDARIMKHSEKPKCVRERIVELVGDLPRVELFAREKVAGWDAIGDEIDGKDIRDVII